MSSPWRCSAAALVLAAFTGCATSGSGIYHWGAYEDAVHALCNDFAESDLETEVQQLSQAVSAAAAEGRRVPPGAHAHLGYLHYLAGDRGLAVQHFEQEKALFPESTRFIDGLLARMGP